MGTVYNRGTAKKPRWWIRWIEPSGRRRYKRIGADRVLAKRVLAKIEADILAGQHGLGPESGAVVAFPLFADVIVSWAEKRRETHRAATADVGRVKHHLLPFFGRMRLDEIGTADVRTFIERSRRRIGAQTIIHCLHLLSRFYNERIEDGENLANPVARLGRASRKMVGLKHDPRRTPYLKTKNDIRKLFLALPPLRPNRPVRAMLAVGAFAGLRTDEILGLTKANVDIDRRIITIDRSARGPLKDDEVRFAPVNDTLLQVLREWFLIAPPGELLFPPTKGRGRHVRAHTLYRYLKQALIACSLPKMTWYQVTRHTFASHYVMDGGSIEKLSMILGHSSIATTQRYAHLVPDHFDRRDFGAACVDLSEPKVLVYDGARKGMSGYAGVTTDDRAQNGGS